MELRRGQHEASRGLPEFTAIAEAGNRDEAGGGEAGHTLL